ncbi:MAG TPA: hypothetical protein VK791_04335 [bacterium]|nr:hypothetical protein [bacterium]
MRFFIFLLLIGAATAAKAQYQTNPTSLFPVTSNPTGSNKTPPQNKVISTQDKQKPIALHKADRFYKLKQDKTIPITSNAKSKPVTSWTHAKKPAYSSLYQDPSTVK